ncbi:MAG TPA: SRPBCC domain-containing protein [Candidatus Koribacter sp.]|jgi:uncharacterized protein YndB with AHSA1/START domain
MEFKFKVHIKIQKPIAEVFDGIYNPKKLSGYFTTGGASAPLDEGTTVQWDFADFPGAFPVKVTKTIKNELIALTWEAGEADAAGKRYDTHVEMRFESLGPKNTLVTITEGRWNETEAGLKGSYGNCMGWTQMLCCLKGYLEHGLNLREGAF